MSIKSSYWQMKKSNNHFEDGSDNVLITNLIENNKMFMLEKIPFLL